MKLTDKIYFTQNTYETTLILGMMTKLYYRATDAMPPEEYVLIKSIFEKLSNKHIKNRQIQACAKALKSCLANDIEINYENLVTASPEFKKICKDKDSFTNIVAKQLFPSYEDIVLFQEGVAHPIETGQSILDLFYENPTEFKNPELTELVKKIKEVRASLGDREVENYDYKSGQELVDDYEKEEVLRDAGKGFYTCGFSALDKYLNVGFAPKKISVIGGRTGVGKSAFSLCLMKNLAAKKIHVAENVIEMDNISFLDRYISATSLVDIKKLVKERDTRTESEKFQIKLAKERIASHPYLHLNDKPAPTIDAIRDAIIKLQKKIGQKYCVIFIDLFDKIKNLQERRSGMQDNFHIALNEILTLAKELDVHFVLVSQISRDSEKRTAGNNRPKISELKHSGMWEEIADIIFLVDRPAYRIMDEESEQMAEAIEPERIATGFDYQSIDSFQEKYNSDIFSKINISVSDNKKKKDDSKGDDSLENALKESQLVKVGNIVIPVKQYAEVILAKQRSGDMNKVIPFIYKGEYSLFTSVSLVSTVY